MKPKATIILIFNVISLWGICLTNPDYHFSFSIPNNWDTIPFAILKQAEERAKELATDKENVQKFDGGLYLKKNIANYFEYPYILYMFKPVENLNKQNFEEILDVIKLQLTNQKFSEEYNNYPDLLSNMNSNILFIDSVRNVILYNFETDYANVGKIKSTMAIFIGAQGVLYVYCYSYENDFNDFSIQFNDFLKSTSFEKGYEYENNSSNANSSSKYWQLFGSALVIGIFFYFKNRKKRPTISKLD